MAEPERAVGLVAAVGALVLPEDGVQDVARDVEGERLLESHDGAEVVLVAGGGQLLERLVGAGDVGGVVLVVVELHDLSRHVGLEGAVVVGQIGERVIGHWISSSSRYRGLCAGPYPTVTAARPGQGHGTPVYAPGTWAVQAVEACASRAAAARTIDRPIAHPLAYPRSRDTAISKMARWSTATERRIDRLSQHISSSARWSRN